MLYHILDAPWRIDRPAIVVAVHDPHTVALQVFTNGITDGGECECGILHREAVSHGPAVGQWEWPTVLVPDTDEL